MSLSLLPNYWILRQNYGSKTNQEQMRNLIISKKMVTCPWGGWGIERENVIKRQYNNAPPNRPGARSSINQDKKFVEEMKIGDIVLIPFTKIKKGCIIARISSNVENSIDTGLFKTETERCILFSEEGSPLFKFEPVGRYIEIINVEFLPETRIYNIQTLSKMSSVLMTQLLIES
jgi:hypothetical protein